MSESGEQIDRRRPYFKEQYERNVKELQKAEIQRREELRKNKALSLQVEGRCVPLRRYGVTYSHATGFHGCRYLSEKRSLCEKIYWAFIISACTVACIYMVHISLMEYQDTSVIVSFSRDFVPIYTTAFPAVTICPDPKTVYSFISATNSSNQSPIEQLVILQQYYELLCAEETVSFKEEDEFFGNEFYVHSDKTRQSVDDIFLNCELFGKKWDCSDLFFPTITDEGICFTFNMVTRQDLFKGNVFLYNSYYLSKETEGWRGQPGYSQTVKMKSYPLHALLSGTQHALRVTLKSKDIDRNAECKEMAKGYRILIHNNVDVPRPYKHHLAVPPSKSVSVAVEPKVLGTHPRVEKMSVAKRECYLENEKSLSYFKMYSPNNCLLECLTDFVLENCKCVMFYMPRQKDTPICTSRHITCARRAESSLEYLEIRSQVNSSLKSYCNCKVLCTEINFKTEVSQTVWNWEGYYEEQWDPEKAKELKKINNKTDSLSIISIYFKQSHFTPVMRFQMHGIPDLISNIGGYLSFFTGISMISIVEAIYFLSLRLLCNKIKYGMWSGP